MNDEKTRLKSLIRADKDRFLNWKRVLLFSSLFLFMSLFAVSISAVDYYPEPDSWNRNEPEVFVLSEASGRVAMNIPKWSVGVFVLSLVGLLSIFLGSRMDKRIILERKNWLASWSQLGTVNYKLFRKQASISTKRGEIVISKIEDRYLVELPFFNDIEWQKFGIKKAEDDLFSISDKNELLSILHVYFSHAS